MVLAGRFSHVEILARSVRSIPAFHDSWVRVDTMWCMSRFLTRETVRYLDPALTTIGTSAAVG